MAIGLTAGNVGAIRAPSTAAPARSAASTSRPKERRILGSPIAGKGRVYADRRSLWTRDVRRERAKGKVVKCASRLRSGLVGKEPDNAIFGTNEGALTRRKTVSKSLHLFRMEHFATKATKCLGYDLFKQNKSLYCHYATVESLEDLKDKTHQKHSAYAVKKLDDISSVVPDGFDLMGWWCTRMPANMSLEVLAITKLFGPVFQQIVAHKMRCILMREHGNIGFEIEAMAKLSHLFRGSKPKKNLLRFERFELLSYSVNRRKDILAVFRTHPRTQRRVEALYAAAAIELFGDNAHKIVEAHKKLFKDEEVAKARIIRAHCMELLYKSVNKLLQEGDRFCSRFPARNVDNTEVGVLYMRLIDQWLRENRGLSPLFKEYEEPFRLFLSHLEK